MLIGCARRCVCEELVKDNFINMKSYTVLATYPTHIHARITVIVNVVKKTVCL